AVAAAARCANAPDAGDHRYYTGARRQIPSLHRRGARHTSQRRHACAMGGDGVVTVQYVDTHYTLGRDWTPPTAAADGSEDAPGHTVARVYTCHAGQTPPHAAKCALHQVAGSRGGDCSQ